MTKPIAFALTLAGLLSASEAKAQHIFHRGAVPIGGVAATTVSGGDRRGLSLDGLLGVFRLQRLHLLRAPLRPPLRPLDLALHERVLRPGARPLLRPAGQVTDAAGAATAPAFSFRPSDQPIDQVGHDRQVDRQDREPDAVSRRQTS